MNTLTNIKNLNAMNERELEMGLAGTKNSWHMEYKDSAWIFLGGVPYELTEGDLLAVFSQYGEIVHINLIRDHESGKSKGFGFICYQDQRSTILAVDNLNGIRLCKRTVRVDHVQTYKLPKDLEKMDADRKRLFLEGCAPKPIKQDETSEEEEELLDYVKEEGKSSKKKKKKDKKKKKKKKRETSSDESSSEEEKRKKKKRKKETSDSEAGSSGDERRRKRKRDDSEDRRKSRRSPSAERRRDKSPARRRDRSPKRERSPYGKREERREDRYERERRDRREEHRGRRDRSRDRR